MEIYYIYIDKADGYKHVYIDKQLSDEIQLTSQQIKNKKIKKNGAELVPFTNLNGGRKMVITLSHIKVYDIQLQDCRLSNLYKGELSTIFIKE